MRGYFERFALTGPQLACVLVLFVFTVFGAAGLAYLLRWWNARCD